MKKSFSLIELIIVIIIVGILYTSVNFTLADTTLNQTADKLMANINYTRHLALKDNKMQYYPISNNNIDMNRSKYWFKSWWQFRLGKARNDYFYEIFSDSPYSTNIYDRVGNPISEFAINPNNKLYLAGNYAFNSDKDLNLSTSGIKRVLYNDNDFTSSIRFIFDNYGSCYLSEGDAGDAGDINPYNINKRVPSLKTQKITLCKDSNCEKNISICITAKTCNTYICK
jgi:prepilin-type N-terminal cleavage/methylation domain-containing protein